MKTEENKIHWQILAFPTGIRFLLNPENITNEEEIFNFLKGIKADEKEKIREVLNKLKESKEEQIEKILELCGIVIKFHYNQKNI